MSKRVSTPFPDHKAFPVDNRKNIWYCEAGPIRPQNEQGTRLSSSFADIERISWPFWKNKVEWSLQENDRESEMSSMIVPYLLNDAAGAEYDIKCPLLQCEIVMNNSKMLIVMSCLIRGLDNCLHQSLNGFSIRNQCLLSSVAITASMDNLSRIYGPLYRQESKMRTLPETWSSLMSEINHEEFIWRCIYIIVIRILSSRTRQSESSDIRVHWLTSNWNNSLNVSV
jgi:hypothetical protein